MAERRVFVFDLQHQHRTAVRGHQRLHHRRDRRDITAYRGHVIRIVPVAHPDVRVAQQIGRQTAEIPFAADVRTGPQIHPHAFFRANADEAREVAAVAREVEHTGFRFQRVPHRIKRDGVEAHRLGHPDAVPPVFARNPDGMHFAASDHERLAVQQELPIGKFEPMRAAIGQGFGTHALRRRHRTQARGERRQRRQHAQAQKSPAPHIITGWRRNHVALIVTHALRRPLVPRHYAFVRICIYNSQMKLDETATLRGEPLAMPRSHSLRRDDTERPSLMLAADVGGTHARIGLLQARAGAQPPLEMLARHVYECAKWPGLGEILQDFLAHHANGRGGIARCALAVAGYLRGDELVAENLRWPVRISELRAHLKLDRLDIVNDFEALACGTRFLSARDSIAVIDAKGTPGPTVVVGPGTGLGCAVVLTNGDGSIVMPSEAGHVALAPGNDREIEVLRRLGRDRGYVHTGHALSGPGLVNLYRALAEIEGVAAIHEAPAAVSAAAISGNDLLAREAL